jgi:hypothetical protein
MAEGMHTFFVRAIGPMGKVDQTPASVTWTVDKTPPDTFIAGAPANPTTNTRATFGIASSESPGVFQCRLDGADWTSCTAPWDITGLTVGLHRFEARAIDAVGWVDPTPAVYEWSVVGSAGGSGATPPSSPGDRAVQLAPPAPGQALVAVSRLATVGAARIDRGQRRVGLLIVCRGPGTCTGRLDIIIRGRRVASAAVQLAAGGQRRISLAIVRGTAVALRPPTPRTASLSLIRGNHTKLENSSLGVLTDRRSRG